VSPAKQPREEVHVDVEGRTLRLSNLDKVLYPRTGTTKGEVLHYYAQVAPTLLPHLADRAVTRIRWPHGVAEGSFFEKSTGMPLRTLSRTSGVMRLWPSRRAKSSTRCMTTLRTNDGMRAIRASASGVHSSSSWTCAPPYVIWGITTIGVSADGS